MKVITVDKDNIKDVYGRIQKFFHNKNHTGFINWHNFDCGFKKHIPAYSLKCGTKVRHEYPSPKRIELMGNYRIAIVLNASSGMCINWGDKIAFLGNRIIIRTNSILDTYMYIYNVFQAAPMSLHQQRELRYIALMEHEMFERDYANERLHDITGD